MSTGVRVTLDGVDVSCHAFAPLNVSRGREHPGDSFEPARLTCQFDEVAAPRRGQTVVVELNAPEANPTWADVVGAWSAQVVSWAGMTVRVVVFRGRITDTSTTWQPVVPHVEWDVVTDVLAVDPCSELANIYVGASAYPAETVAVRAARIQAECAVAGFTKTWTNDPSTLALAARTAERAMALGMLDELCETASLAGGVWYDAVNDRMLWTLDTSRMSTVPVLTFDTCQVGVDVELVETVTDIVNDIGVEYATGTVTASDVPSITENGRRTKSVSTDLSSSVDANTRALSEVARFSRALRRFASVSMSSDVIVNRAEAETLLTLPPGARVRLTDLPTPSVTEWDGYTEGWSLDVDADRWLVTVNLSPAGWTGPLLSWAGATHSPTARWQDVKPGYAWRDATDYLLWIV